MTMRASGAMKAAFASGVGIFLVEAEIGDEGGTDAEHECQERDGDAQ